MKIDRVISNISLRGRCILCLFLVLFSGLTQAQIIYHKPATTFIVGNLGLTYNLNQVYGNSLNNSGGLVGTLKSKTTTAGFIYRPWFLTSRLGFDLNLNHNIYNSYDQEIQTSALGSGRASLNFYPTSVAPTTIDLNIDKNAQWGDENNYTDALRFKAVNSFSPKSLPLTLRSTLSWLNESESRNNRKFESVEFLSNMSQRVSDSSSYNISINAQSRKVQLEQVDLLTNLASEERTINDRYGIDYNQQWQISNTGFASMIASYQVEQSSEQHQSAEQHYGQVSSLMFFQSELDTRLNYNLNFLAGTNKNSSKNLLGVVTNETKSRSYNVNSGFNFQYSDRLAIIGSVNINQNIAGDTENTGFTQHLSVSYFDETTFRQDIDYSWDARISANGNQNSSDTNDEVGDSFTLSPSIRHYVSTNVEIAKQQLTLTLSQGLSHVIDDMNSNLNEPSQWLMQHNSSLTWQHDGINSKTDVLFSLADYRHLNSLPRNEQTIYLTLQRHTQVDSDSDWGGNLNYEFRQVNSDLNIKTNTQSLSGSLWYKANDFFEVPRLNYRSTLTLPVNKLLFNDQSSENNTTSWQNRLDFRMGLLEATAQMDMTLDSYNISISVKRYFGMPL